MGNVGLIKGKGYRYDFTVNGQRYTKTWFKTKTKANMAESERRKEVLEPPPSLETPTDMGFLELVNRRLDHVKSYNSAKHYNDSRYLARRWTERWGGLTCAQITQEMVELFVLERSGLSAHAANKEIRYLRTTFNLGKRKKWITNDPTQGIRFLPVEKKAKYIPPPEHIDTVISFADQETQEYLWTIRDTMGQVSEINRLAWPDVNLESRYVTLYTRKKKGGHLTPRKIPMTQRLFEILSRRFQQRDPSKPWVFWHTYWSSKTGEKCQGPFGDRKKIMGTLCQKAEVPYFRFHALRHCGASVMDANNVPLGSIQRILGHENRKTTEIYLHSIGEAEREAMAIFERASQKSHTASHIEQTRRTRSFP